MIIVDAERYSFLVIEESLPTETISEYRRGRAPRRRPRMRRVWAVISGRFSRPEAVAGTDVSKDGTFLDNAF